MSPGDPISTDSIVRRRPDALAADVAGEIVLMSVEHGKYYGLDAIASDVWQRLEQPIAVRELCEALCVIYQGEPPAIERDVMALLAQLASEDLIESVPA